MSEVVSESPSPVIETWVRMPSENVEHVLRIRVYQRNRIEVHRTAKHRDDRGVFVNASIYVGATFERLATAGWVDYSAPG